ncbi:DUF120 domain-containing protein [archaeon]|nr:DUF120 domain-containing protein [archaeon]
MHAETYTLGRPTIEGLPPTRAFGVFAVLLELARRGAHIAPVEVSERELGVAIGKSQQTASRLLRLLEKQKLVERVRKGVRSLVWLTDEGVAVLVGCCYELHRVLGEPVLLHFKGTVTTGVGEGVYYMQHPRYAQAFENVLGFRPYPGTLNLKLRSWSEVARLHALRKVGGFTVPGFVDDRRSYGAVFVFPARIAGRITGAAIMPERSRYRDVLEVIAPVCLREELGLRDGDEVEVVVSIPPIIQERVVITRLRERCERYIRKCEHVLRTMKVLKNGKTSRVIKLAHDYFKDAVYYLEKGDVGTSLACISYAEGLLDGLRLMGYASFTWE